MPRVPSYGGFQATPTVQPAGALEAVNPQIHQGVFNGVKALQESAQGLSEYAQEAFEQANKTRAQDAINNFTADLQNVMYGQDGMMRRKGQAVVSADEQTSFTDEGMQKYSELASKYAVGMNPQQLKMYNEYLDKKRIEVSKTLLDHEVREGNAWSLEVAATNVTRATDSIAINGADRNARQQDIVSIRDSYKDMGKINGWSAEYTKLQGDKAVSTAVVSVIGGLIQNGDVGAAKALFDEESAKGNIRGSDALRIRGTLDKAIKEKVADSAASQIAVSVANDHDITYQMADQLIANNYMTPELEKKLEGVTDQYTIRDIYAQESDRLIQSANGDLDKACEFALVGKDVADELDPAIQSAKEQAMVMRGKILTATDTGTKVTEADIRQRAVARFPDATPDEIEKIVKKSVDQVDAYYKNVDSKRANTIAVARADILNPDSNGTPDTTGLTAKQIQDLEFFRDYASKGKYDTGYAETLKSAPALLKSMSEAEFASAMLRVSDADAKAFKIMRDHLNDKNTKTGMPPEAMINQVFNNYVLNKHNDLNDKDNRYAKSVLRAEFERLVEEETQKQGRRLDSKEVEALLPQLNFSIGETSFSAFSADEELNKNSDGKDAIKVLAQSVGWDSTTDEGLVVFARRLMAKDDLRLGSVSIRDVNSIFSKHRDLRAHFEDELYTAKKQGKIAANWEPSANDKARWLLDKLYTENLPKGPLPEPVNVSQLNTIWGND